MTDIDITTPEPAAQAEVKLTHTIAVITEVHQAEFRRVALPETACCPPFEEEFGKEFMLTADGGLAPASLRIERVKLGKIIMDKPKIGWRECPFCYTSFVADPQTVIKTSPAGE